VLANFLEVNQFLVVELMLLNKISIAQARAQALALRAYALAFYTQDLALYPP
jgi:hypothetical protein